MNSSDTQREAYAKFANSGRVSQEKRIVIQALSKLDKPVNRRQLVLLTGLPQHHLCRVLFNLKHPKPPIKPLVEIAFKAKCSETGMTVQYYQLIKQGK